MRIVSDETLPEHVHIVAEQVVDLVNDATKGLLPQRLCLFTVQPGIMLLYLSFMLLHIVNFVRHDDVILTLAGAHDLTFARHRRVREAPSLFN